MPQDHVRSDLMKQFYLFVQTCQLYLWTHKSFYKSSFVCSIRNWWNMSIIKCVIIVVFMASASIKFMPVKLGDSKFCIKHKIATIGVHLSITLTDNDIQNHSHKSQYFYFLPLLNIHHWLICESYNFSIKYKMLWYIDWYLDLMSAWKITGTDF